MCVYGIFIRWIRNNIYGLWSEVEQQGSKNMDEFSPNVTSCKSKRINCAFSCHPILLLCRLSYMLCSAVVCGRYGGGVAGRGGYPAWLWIRCENANFRHWVASLLVRLQFALWFRVCICNTIYVCVCVFVYVYDWQRAKDKWIEDGLKGGGGGGGRRIGLMPDSSLNALNFCVKCNCILFHAHSLCHSPFLCTNF